ncbi:MAG: hypothetical protein WA030_02885 [Candidatus Microsaccharimonas sp.]
MSDLTNWISQQQRDYQRKLGAWEQALVVIGYDRNRVRKDAHGTFIVWSEYGQRTAYGWEIDHELPKAHFPGIANAPANLRALHWRNNRTKSDGIDIATLSKLLGRNQ